MGLRLSHIVQVLVNETIGAAASYCDLIVNFLIPAEKRARATTLMETLRSKRFKERFLLPLQAGRKLKRLLEGTYQDDSER